MPNTLELEGIAADMVVEASPRDVEVFNWLVSHMACAENKAAAKLVYSSGELTLFISTGCTDAGALLPSVASFEAALFSARAMSDANELNTSTPLGEAYHHVGCYALQTKCTWFADWCAKPQTGACAWYETQAVSKGRMSTWA